MWMSNQSSVLDLQPLDLGNFRKSFLGPFKCSNYTSKPSAANHPKLLVFADEVSFVPRMVLLTSLSATLVLPQRLEPVSVPDCTTSGNVMKVSFPLICKWIDWFLHDWEEAFIRFLWHCRVVNPWFNPFHSLLYPLKLSRCRKWTLAWDGLMLWESM